MNVSTLFALSAALVITACGTAPAPVAPAASAASPTPSTAAAPPSASKAKEPGDAKVGETTKCPVSGEEFVVEATSPKSEHDGKTYYFCCAGCKKKFEAEPGKFAKKS